MWVRVADLLGRRRRTRRGLHRGDVERRGRCPGSDDSGSLRERRGRLPDPDPVAGSAFGELRGDRGHAAPGQLRDRGRVPRLPDPGGLGPVASVVRHRGHLRGVTGDLQGARPSRQQEHRYRTAREGLPPDPERGSVVVKFSVIIPYRRAPGLSRLYFWVLAWWEANFPDAQICVADTADIAFNRGGARNHGVEMSAWDLLCLADADTVPQVAAVSESLEA